MRLTPKNIDQLYQALIGLPGNMKIEADPDTGVSEKTVDELRSRVTWPTGLVVVTPREHYPEVTVTISQANAMPRDGAIIFSDRTVGLQSAARGFGGSRNAHSFCHDPFSTGAHLYRH